MEKIRLKKLAGLIKENIVNEETDAMKDTPKTFRNDREVYDHLINHFSEGSGNVPEPLYYKRVFSLLNMDNNLQQAVYSILEDLIRSKKIELKTKEDLKEMLKMVDSQQIPSDWNSIVSKYIKY